MLANRSTALVKRAIVSSGSPCSSPSRTQWLMCPSSTTCPTLCKADLAALSCARTSSQGTSSVSYTHLTLSIACTCPIIFLRRRCKFSEFMHCFMAAFPDAAEGYSYYQVIRQTGNAVKNRVLPRQAAPCIFQRKHRTVFHYFPLFSFCRGTFFIPCSSFRAECGWEPGISERGQILPHKIRHHPGYSPDAFPFLYKKIT